MTNVHTRRNDIYLYMNMNFELYIINVVIYYIYIRAIMSAFWRG